MSDIDLILINCFCADRDQIIEMLQTLEYNLGMCKFVKDTKAILSATVPVLKIKADPSIPF